MFSKEDKQKRHRRLLHDSNHEEETRQRAINKLDKIEEIEKLQKENEEIKGKLERLSNIYDQAKSRYSF